MNSCAVMLLAVSSLAMPVINGGTHYVPLGATAELQVSVSGGDAVRGLNLYVQIGDGGAPNGGSLTAPIITAIDVTGSGTIFNASNTGQYTAQDPPAPAQSLIWSAQTTTSPTLPVATPGYVNASGTLALITVNTAGAIGASYPLRLSNVHRTAFPPSGATTDFAGTPTTVIDGTINILHDMVWNASASGHWEDTTWSNSWTLCPFPDDSAHAIINTAHTVTLDTANRHAYSLNISGGGSLSVTASGNLAAVTTATVGSSGTLALTPGAGFTATGIALAGGTISLSGIGTVIAPPITVGNGTISAPSTSDIVTLHSPLSGTGSLTKSGPGTVVLDMADTYSGGTIVSGGTLRIAQVNALPQGRSLTIQAGGTVVLASGLSTAGAGAGVAARASAVPEPGTVTLLAAGVVALLAAAWRRRLC